MIENRLKLGAATGILSLLVTFNVFGQLENIDKQRIIPSLEAAANYTISVLIDEKGRSRGNYDSLEDQWYATEPFARTGQLIEGLLAVYELKNDAMLLDAAKKAGTWALTLEIKNNPVMKDMVYASPGSHDLELLSYTTLAEGATGMYKLSKATGDKRYGAMLTRASSWVYGKMYNEKDGTFYNIVNPRTGEILKVKSKSVSKDNRISMFTTMVRPNLEGSLFERSFRASNNFNYKYVFVAQCEAALKKQSENGLWMELEPNIKETRTVHPTFNTRYALALIDCYELTENKSYLHAAHRAGFALKYLQQPDGTIYSVNFSDGRFEDNYISGSSVALNGLLWLRLKKHGYEDFNEQIANSANWILNKQFPEEQDNLDLAGGYLETTFVEMEGRKITVIPDIATATGMLFLSELYKVLPD